MLSLVAILSRNTFIRLIIVVSLISSESDLSLPTSLCTSSEIDISSEDLIFSNFTMPSEDVIASDIARANFLINVSANPKLSGG